MQRYTQYLPSELNYELALLRPWRELQATYADLPEYEQLLKNPNHSVWEKLYQRDVSSYLLPKPGGFKYRDQYFLAMDLIENHPIEGIFQKMAQMGYDKAYQRIYNQLVEFTPEIVDDLKKSVKVAVKGGYVNIVKFALPKRVDITYYDEDRDDGPYLMAGAAADADQLEILDYIYTAYKLREQPNWEAIVFDRAMDAAYEGRPDVVMWALREVPFINICRLRDEAAHSDNIELFDELDNQCDEPLTDQEIFHYALNPRLGDDMREHLTSLLPTGTVIPTERPFPGGYRNWRR